MIETIQFEPSYVTRTAPVPVLSLSGTRFGASSFLSREERLALEAAVSPARKVARNFDLVREGGGTDALFILTEGWACRYTSTREGNRHLPALLVPGDIGNLDALMFDRSDYGVRTITQATVVSLPRSRALALADQHAGIARTFMWLGLIENAILSKWAQSLGRRSSIERVAHLLCELSVRLNPKSEEATSLAFPLTQEQMGDALGLTSVHVNRTMQHLRSKGLIETAKGSVTLRDVEGLRRLGGFDPRYLHVGPLADARPTQV